MWRRPTLPDVTPVPSALQGLTSLFGMGRGGTPALGRLNWKTSVTSIQYQEFSTSTDTFTQLGLIFYRSTYPILDILYHVLDTTLTYSVETVTI